MFVIILLMESYYSNEPFKLLKTASIQASKITKNLEQHPQGLSDLKSLALKQRDAVKAGIDNSRHQNDIFRRLEEEDTKKRQSIQEQLEKRSKQTLQNKAKIIKKKQEEVKVINQKVIKTYDRHQDDTRNKVEEEEEQAIKMQSEREEAIAQNQKRRINNDKGERSYDAALKKIKVRQALVGDFSARADERLQSSFRKNAKRANPEGEETKSQRMKKYMKVLAEQKSILNQRVEKFLHKHCSNIENGMLMRDKKKDEWHRKTDSIQKFNKAHSEKAHLNKEYIDEESTAIPEKCQERINNSLMVRTKNATNPFMATSNSWRSENRSKKESLREIQQKQHDLILDRHFSSTLRNKGEDSIHNKFLDLQRRASFNAREFL